jgi:glycerol-3-phosphate dehydrogenase (NAD(P)+)
MSSTPPTHVGIYGTGHFGYALVRHLEPKTSAEGDAIELRGYDQDEAVRTALAHRLPHPYDDLPTPLGPRVRIVDGVASLVRGVDVLIIAVNSGATREVCRELLAVTWDRPLIVVNTAKALDAQTGRRLSQVYAEMMPRPPRPMTYGVLSGGTIAGELLRQNPLGVTVACADEPALARLAALFSAPNMWVQPSTDVVGVELAGAFKNIVAICAGMVHGMEFSYGSETHLISRMAQEIGEFCVRCLGAHEETFRMGSQCWGSDLWMSCTGPTRNRALGELLGRGLSLTEAHEHMKAQRRTVEGVETLQSLHHLLGDHPGELRLLRAAERVIIHRASPQTLIDALMQPEAGA